MSSCAVNLMPFMQDRQAETVIMGTKEHKTFSHFFDLDNFNILHCAQKSKNVTPIRKNIIRGEKCNSETKACKKRPT